MKNIKQKEIVLILCERYKSLAWSLTCFEKIDVLLLDFLFCDSDEMQFVASFILPESPLGSLHPMIIQRILAHGLIKGVSFLILQFGYVWYLFIDFQYSFL